MISKETIHKALEKQGISDPTEQTLLAEIIMEQTIQGGKEQR